MPTGKATKATVPTGTSVTDASTGLRRCAVWGSPIEHSLSPLLHRAAYAALGLTDWHYERREVTAATFETAIADLDAQGDYWVGLSLTMPLKELALAAAVQASDTARVTGSANTLVRHDDGWHAHNTDVYGIRAALSQGVAGPAPRTALLVGSGATARSAVCALADSGVHSVTFLVREAVRPVTMAQARAAGLEVDVAPWGSWPLRDLVVSTVPPATVVGLDGFPPATHGGAIVLDVVYGSGQTPLERAALGRGWAIAGGVEMLLHQAGEQIRLMTGRAAPLSAMRAALPAASPTPAS